jgi:hypothetical protein
MRRVKHAAKAAAKAAQLLSAHWPGGIATADVQNLPVSAPKRALQGA